jgi:hypothetical protein
MKQGKMYRVKNLLKNVRNRNLTIVESHPSAPAPVQRLQTIDGSWCSPNKVLLADGDVVACVGVESYVTHHYEKQPFYKVLTLTGHVAYVSKGNRNKYFELVRG